MVDTTLIETMVTGALAVPLVGLTFVGAGMFGAKLLNIARQALFEGVKETRVADPAKN